MGSLVDHPDYCPPEITPGAKYLIVGEAPGADEVRHRRPFCGVSGKFLDGALAVAKLTRRQFSITNACLVRPPGNKIEEFFPKGKPNALVEESVDCLRATIEEEKPEAILALGNTALWALTGHRQITKRRGSLYEWKGGIPVLPTLHPAAVLREPIDANIFARDLARFGELVRGRLRPRLERRLVLWPTDEELEEAQERCFRAEWIAVDIETGGGKLQCVGFAPDPRFAICIPADTITRIKAINVLLASERPKIFHNAPYDVPYLMERCDIWVNGPLHDTLAMHQALHPELPRDLGTLVSLYTNEPYFKDLGIIWKVNNDLTTYWRYNALDCATTIEVAEVLKEKLHGHGLWDVYERTRTVLPHAIAMSMRGVRYCKTTATAIAGRLERNIARYQHILDGRAGRPINVSSPVQCARFLYTDLRLPLRRSRDSGNPTTGQRVILGLYPSILDRHVRQAVRALLAIRHDRKLISAYLALPTGRGGRMRTSFNPAGTETGRWSAGKYLIDEGANLQTVTPRWKPCFPADDGMLLWHADYSQIEARIVSYLAGDQRSIRIFESGGDIHRENAAVIFGKAPDKISKRERDIGKTVHALNYGVGVDELMESVNKRALETNVWISRDLAKYVRNTYLSNFDQVVRWQELTWETVQKTRQLTNPFGRRRIFLGPTRGVGAEHTKKEALAFVPQSTVPDLLNPVLVSLRVNRPAVGFEVLLNLHDALFGQGPIEEVDTWVPVIRKTMGRSIPVNGSLLQIPVDIQVGSRWDQMTPRLFP